MNGDKEYKCIKEIKKRYHEIELGNEFVLDPSFLFLLTHYKIELKNKATFYIADSLYFLIEEIRSGIKEKGIRETIKKNEKIKTLEKILVFFTYKNNLNISEEKWLTFYNNISKLRIEPIIFATISDNEREQFRKTFRINKKISIVKNGNKINLLLDILLKHLSFSKKEGIPIVTRTRKLFNLLREKITIIELPFIYKKIFFDKIFDFKGGILLKIFIAFIIAKNNSIFGPDDIVVFYDPALYNKKNNFM